MGEKSSFFMFEWLKETDDPDWSFFFASFFSVLCVLYIPLCCCPTTRLHKVMGHKERDTEMEWGARLSEHGQGGRERVVVP